MRIATYRDDAGLSWGVITPAGISDAREFAGAPLSVTALLEGPDRTSWLRRLADPLCPGIHPLWSVRLLAPLQPQRDLVALGLNYAQHVDETNQATGQLDRPKWPILFGKAASSVVGPDCDVRFDRSITSQVDWEVELAVVIADRCRDLDPERAMEYVFGYTVANDISARDLQFLDGGQWYRGKSLDTFCPLGPWIVTRDDLGDARGLRIQLRVNGTVKQSGFTDQLIFDIPAILASASAGRTLYPGDVILTGTPGGVGFSRKPPEFLRDGDVIEAEVEGIGVLRSRVVEISRMTATA